MRGARDNALPLLYCFICTFQYVFVDFSALHMIKLFYIHVTNYPFVPWIEESVTKEQKAHGNDLAKKETQAFAAFVFHACHQPDYSRFMGGKR
jgi:hypothetical protein